jgi:hypothetical protein
MKTVRKVGTHVFWPRTLADRYGISPVTLWRYEQRGQIPARDFEIAGRSGWTRDAIEQFEIAASNRIASKVPRG